MAKLILLACGRLQEIEQVRDSIDYVQFTCTGLVAKAIKIRVGTKPGLWTLDWTMDWTMDWIMDSILDLILD